MTNTVKRRVFDFYPLESRILLSGDTVEGAGMPIAGDVTAALLAELDPQHGSAEGWVSSASPATAQNSELVQHEDAAAEGLNVRDPDVSLEVVFIDASVQDAGVLLAGLRGESANESQWLVIEIAADQDGIDQISQTLESLSGVNAVHILSHANGTGISLGATQLNIDSSEAYAGQIAGWAPSLDQDADVLIYGCGLASTDEGRALIESIANLCDCDVAASDDATGNEKLGGDWDLEYRVGEVETSVAFDNAAQANWLSVLDHPIGSETTVASTSAAESNPEVSIADSGDFVVVWEADQGGSDGTDIYFQRYEADGTVQGNATRVNTTVSGDQNQPSVAMRSDGGFVVVWDGNGQPSGQEDSQGIFMQHYDSTGNAQGGETIVNSNNRVESHAAIAMNATDEFVIVWESTDEIGSDFDIYLQRFDSSGTAQGSEIRANTTTSQDQFAPDVAMASDGSFVVTWEGHGDESGASDSHGVFFQQFDSSAVAQGNEVRVNTTTSGTQSNADIAMTGDGDFVVVWAGEGMVYHQRFDANATAVNGEVMETDGLLGPYASPAVTMTSTDGFVLVYDGDGSLVADDIYKHTYDSNGMELSAVQVNTTDDVHSEAAVATAIDGDSVVVWQSLDSLTGEDRIALQRYGSAVPPVITSGSLLTANPNYHLPVFPSGTTSYNNQQIVQWDGEFAALFSGPAFSNNTQIDAIANQANGNLLLSVGSTTVLGGTLEFGSGDIVEYNPTTGDVSLFLKGSLLANGPDSFGNTSSIFLSNGGEPVAENIDAFHIRHDGKILLSVEGAAGMDDGTGTRLALDDADIVLYDPLANAASLLFDFSGLYAGDINAISEQASGLLTLSTGTSITLPNGDVFTRSDLFDFNYTDGAIDGLVPLQGRAHSSNPGEDFANSGGGSSSPNLNGATWAQAAATATYSVAEGMTLVTQVTASAAVGSTLTFGISGGADSASFVIDSTTGILKFAASPDFETPTDTGGDNDYQVEVTVTDANSASDVQLITVSVTDVLPGNVVDVDAGSNLVVENAPAGTQVGLTAQAMGDVESYFLSDNDGGRFVVDSETGVVTTAVSMDREVDGESRQIEISATDGTTTTSASFTVLIGPVNEHDPLIISGGGGSTASLNLPENATTVTTVIAVDNDLPEETISYAITGGEDAARFTIDPNTGLLEFLVAPDYETPVDVGTDNVYQVEVQASDGNGRTDSQMLNVAIDDLRVSIAGQMTHSFSGSNVTVGHDSSGDDRLMLVTVAMANSGSTVVNGVSYDGVSLSLVGSESYSVDSTNAVRLEMWTLVAPALGMHDVVVDLSASVSDGAIVGVTTFSFVDQLDPWGAFVADGGFGAAASVSSISAQDDMVFSATALESHDNYDLVPAGGQTEIWDLLSDGVNFAASYQDGETSVNSSWTFSPANEWVLAALPIHATVAVNHEPVITSDGGGLFASIDVDEFNATAPDPPPSSFVVTTIQASDSDLGQTLQYNIVGGDDASHFSLDSSSGLLEFVSAPDREVPGDNNNDAVYEIIVQASDGNGGSDVQVMSITLNDVNEYSIGPVSDADAAVNQVAENAVEGTTTGLTGLAIDDDATATVNYILQDDAGGRFQIDPTTGVVSVADGSLLDRESAVSHDVTVLATSSDGSQQTAGFTILLVDVDEFDTGIVVDSDPATNQVTENAVIGTGVGITAAATDDDATNNTVSYSLANDDGGRFGVDAVTGGVFVSGDIDRETDGATRELTVRATSLDGSFTDQAFTVSIMDADEFDLGPISDADSTVNSVDENAATNAGVGITALAIDADAEFNDVTYSMDDTGGGRFRIDPTTGVLTVDDGSLLDREIASSHQVIVRAVSSDGSQQTQTFEIAVNDVDEFDVTATLDVDVAPDQVNENALIGTAVGVTVVASDADATNHGVTYFLDDDDSGRFAVDPVTGVVTVASGIDREALGPLRTIVIRSQGQDGSFTTASIDVAVGDVNEFDVQPGSDVDAEPDAVDENSPAGTATGLTVSALDADATAIVTYSLDDDAQGRFAIDSSTGQLTVLGELDFESQLSHSVSVRALSSDGSQSTQSFVIQVQDVNEPPVAVPDFFERFESADAAKPGVIGNDGDVDGDELSAILVSGPSNGHLTLHADGSFVYTANAGFIGVDTFQYKATDGEFESEPVEVRIEIIAPPPVKESDSQSEDDSAALSDLPGATDGLIGLEMESSKAGDDSEGIPQDAKVNIIRKPDPDWVVSQLVISDELLEVGSEYSMGVAVDALLHARNPKESMETEMLRELLQVDLEQAVVWHQWDALQENMETSPILYVVGSAGSAAGVISVGYLLWIIRGSTVITVLTSSLPSWRMVDPAAILTAYRSSIDDDDDDSVEGMLV